MKTLFRRFNSLLKRIPRILFLKSKEIYQLFKYHSNQKTILFIIGCQRSGTGLMQRIFENDFQTKVYGEFSKLSSNDVNKIRLNPVCAVKKVIDKDKVPLIVLKPLVESQNSLRLLDDFKNSKALWMYRNYKDVAISNLMHFGIKNGIKDIRPIAENEPQNWVSEKVSKNVKKIVFKFFSENMNPYDAAVLFWLVRNSLFFELHLDMNTHVMMCRYEDIVKNPVKVVKGLYKFLGYNFPGEKITTEVKTTSLGKGENIKLSPEIDLLSKKMLDKLDKAYKTKNNYA